MSEDTFFLPFFSPFFMYSQQPETIINSKMGEQMKYRIEFGELKLGNTARSNLMDVCDTSWASSGPKVLEFEKRWSDLFGYKHSMAVSSGTDADINACAALYYLGAKRGD